MATELEELVIRLTADNAELRRELGRSRREVAEAARGMESSFQGVSRSIGDFKKYLVGLGLGATARELVQTTRAALDFADSIGDTAQGLGLTTDALQEMRAVAKTVDVESGQLDRSLAVLSKRTVELLQGSKQAAQGFGLLGISADQIRASGGDLDTVLNLIADGMKRTGSEAVNNAAANDLLGRSGFKLVPALQGGADALAALRTRAHETGQVMRSDLIERFGDTSDSVNALAEGLRVQLYEAFVQLGPVLEDTLALLVKMASGIDEVFDTARRAAFKFGGVAGLEPVSTPDLEERLRDLRELERVKTEPLGGVDYFKREAVELLGDHGFGGEPFDLARVRSEQERIQAELARRNFVGPDIDDGLLAFRQGRAQRDAEREAAFAGLRDAGGARRAEQEAARRVRAAEQAALKIQAFENEITQSTLKESDSRLAAILQFAKQREQEIQRIARSEEEAAQLRVLVEQETAAKIAEEIERVGELRQKEIDKRVALEEQLQRQVLQAQNDTAGLRALDRQALQREIDELQNLSPEQRAKLEALADEAITAKGSDAFDRLADYGVDVFGAFWAKVGEGADITWAEMGKSLLSSLLQAEAEYFARSLINSATGRKTDPGGSILGAIISGIFGIGAGVATGGGGTAPPVIGGDIPLATGGITRTDIPAQLHANEAVIPLERLSDFIGAGPQIVIENHGATVTPKRERGSDGRDQWRILVETGVRDSIDRGGMRDVMQTRHSPGK